MKSKHIRRRCGVVLQDPRQYFLFKTVLEELILGQPYKPPEYVRNILCELGLSDISLRAHPQSLSGGQTRRLAVACQFMKDPLPSLFILDEPLAGVDWTARRDIVRFLGSLKAKFAVLLISHEPSDLLQYADRVVEVSRGGIHNIDPTIVQCAIRTRERLRAERRVRVMEEARLYRLRMAHGDAVTEGTLSTDEEEWDGQ